MTTPTAAAPIPAPAGDDEPTLRAQVASAQQGSTSDWDRLSKRLSPSRASDFAQCPKLFYFKSILRLPTPQSIPAARGTIAHAAFERIFDHPAGERTAELACTYLEPAWKEMTDEDLDADEYPLGSPERDSALARVRSYRDIAPAGSDIERDLLAGAADVVRSWFTMERVNNFTPTGLRLPDGTEIDGREFHAAAEMFGMTLHGFIDRLDRWESPTGEVIWSVSDYKGLAVDTPLPTPSGWTTMGEVAVGDELIGSDGHPTVVTAKSGLHHRPCYRVEFDDGSSIICDNVHLWQIELGVAGKRRRTKVVDADELFRLKHGPFAGTRRKPVVINNAAPLLLPDAELPVDPYVLGVWLGDGDSDSGGIHASAAKCAHLVRELEGSGETTIRVSHARTGMALLSCSRATDTHCTRGHEQPTRRRPDGRARDCWTCHKEGRTGFPKFDALAQRLRWMGLLNNKHVPALYLRASARQRLALLQGLMDTDGSWNSRRNQAVFTTTTLALAAAVQELVHSLGWRSSRHSVFYDSKKGRREAVQVMFTPYDMNPFRMPEKADKVRVEGVRKCRQRIVSAVVPVDSVPTQCVAVAAADQLYLAGRQMVPTHNTGKVPGAGKNYAAHTMERIRYESFFQLRVYALLCKDMLDIDVKYLRLVYVATGERDSGIKTLTMTPQVRESTRAEIQTLWNRITRSARTGQWATRTGPLCPWCDFNDICPAFNPELEGVPVSAS